MWLYGAVRPYAVWVHHLNGWLAGRSIRLIPGVNTQWRPPIPTTDFEDWLVELENMVDDRIAHAVVQLPRDQRRRRFGLLLTNQASTPIAFAKFTMNPLNPIAVEAMRRFGEDPPSGYWAPRLITAGVLNSYSYTVTSTMPNRPHSPAALSPRLRHQIVEDIQDRLADLVQEPEIAIHGDLGAWNVRSFRNGSVAIVDWEDAAAGVTAADELWHAISCTHNTQHDLGLFLRTELPHHDPRVVSLAAQFWLDRLGQPEAAEIDQSIAAPDRLETTATETRDILQRLTAIDST